MVKLEVNSNRLVSGKGISIPAAASLELLILIHETPKENDVLQDGLRQTLASQGC